MDVRLPNLGENAEGGSVVNILVNEGDQVTEGQTIVELENEKAVAPIPAPAAGSIGKIRVKVGDKVSIGQVLLTLTTEGGGAADKTSKGEAKKKAEPKDEDEDEEQEEGDRSGQDKEETEPAEEGDEGEESESTGEQDGNKEEMPSEPGKLPPAAAPSIRKLARDLGLDLKLIRGSERGGRIVLDDVRAYIQRLQKLASRPKGAGPAPAGAGRAESIDFSKWGEIVRKPLTPLRKTIARRMVENWTTIPHVTQFDEADITELMELRKKHAPAYETKGARLTLTSFALKAVASVLKKHPTFNSSLDEAAEELVLKEYFHIGLAVDTDHGLIVPVLRNVDRRNLFELSKEITEVADKARERKISPEDLKGGTFTISNQGGIGGAHFTPIINKPEVAILGLGRASHQARVRDGKILPRLVLPVALSYDHRVIDGGAAARFVTDLVAAFGEFKEEDVRL